MPSFISDATHSPKVNWRMAKLAFLLTLFSILLICLISIAKLTEGFTDWWRYNQMSFVDLAEHLYWYIQMILFPFLMLAIYGFLDIIDEFYRLKRKLKAYKEGRSD